MQEYWKRLKESYPEAMNEFSGWIDKYKQENAWDTIFRGTYFQPSIKFHEIPIAMQCGVIMEFLFQRGKCRLCSDFDEVLNVFTQYLSNLECKLKK